jgi:hypothetical protein
MLVGHHNWGLQILQVWCVAKCKTDQVQLVHKALAGLQPFHVRAIRMTATWTGTKAISKWTDKLSKYWHACAISDNFCLTCDSYCFCEPFFPGTSGFLACQGLIFINWLTKLKRQLQWQGHFILRWHPAKRLLWNHREWKETKKWLTEMHQMVSDLLSVTNTFVFD